MLGLEAFPNPHIKVWKEHHPCIIQYHVLQINFIFALSTNRPPQTKLSHSIFSFSFLEIEILYNFFNFLAEEQENFNFIVLC